MAVCEPSVCFPLKTEEKNCEWDCIHGGNKTYRRRQWWEQSTGVKSHTRLTCPGAPTPPNAAVWSMRRTCLSGRIQTYNKKKMVIQQLTATLIYHTSHLTQTNIHQDLSLACCCQTKTDFLSFYQGSLNWRGTFGSTCIYKLTLCTVL